MNTWQTYPITRRADGSYVITHKGYPYHVVDDEEMVSLWQEVNAYAQEHPEQVTDEPAPPEPTEAELLEIAKASKLAEFDRVMVDIDDELIRSTTDLVAAMLSPATLAADEDGAALSANELDRSKAVFMELRAVQGQNRVLRAQVQAAETVEDVQAIEPVKVDTATLGERRDDTRATSF